MAQDTPQVQPEVPQPKPDVKTVAFELAGDSVIVRTGDQEQTLKIGCYAQSFTSLDTKAYALCAPSTVVFIDASPAPHVVERRALAARVLSLTVLNGAAAARTATGVKPLDEYAVLPPNTELGPAPRLVLHAPKYWTEPKALALPPPEPRGLEINLRGTGGLGFDGPTAVSGLIDAGFTYRFKAPWFIAAYGTFGGATAAFDPGTRDTGPLGGDVQVAVGEALVGLDARFVAFGTGWGVALSAHGYDVEPVLTFRGRVGERDGFEFNWHISFMTGGPDAAGSYGGSLEFRLASRWWLGVEAEFGSERYGRFMFDVRRRVSGDGGRGTVDVRAGFGLGLVKTDATCTSAFNTTLGSGDMECVGTNADYVGPALSLGIVWRP